MCIDDDEDKARAISRWVRRESIKPQWAGDGTARCRGISRLSGSSTGGDS